ncbi:hypothetical protein GCM10025886_25730 [Tetragenococcus halophilus subsp. flandriensis]|nr:hypothetical protein GCM10025886_25730 [Tetragenococcus halophilus subsp. flandriensis]
MKFIVLLLDTIGLMCTFYISSFSHLLTLLINFYYYSRHHVFLIVACYKRENNWNQQPYAKNNDNELLLNGNTFHLIKNKPQRLAKVSEV